MSPMLSLSPMQINAINKASRKAVSDIFQKTNDLKNGRWLSLANSYMIDTTNQIQRDIKANSVNDADLGSYISVSAPLHCVDGWTYLSRAVNSLFQGDFNTARHLGYYAELRAAISILATEGIGILGQDHFVIDDKEKCWQVHGRNGTHKIIWPVFEYWAQQPCAAKLLGSIITPYGINLGDWHSVFSSGSTFPAIANMWLRCWGLDLQQLNTDHETRNEVSYRPFRILSTPPIIPIEISTFIREFWKLFSPSGISKFDEIDRYLLNKSLQVAHSALKDGRTYEERIGSVISAIFRDKEESVLQSYNQFLSSNKNTLVLLEANSTDASNHPRQVYQLLSRACLLLRIATGANADLILSAGISNSGFDFWWKKLGLDAGILDPDNETTSPDELWSDIETSITEVGLWETIVRDPSIYKMHTDNHNAKYFWTLSGTERIAMWGLIR
ncbi:MAG: hypothetical protein FD146_2607 [Anaerolineaceae bacterium]|nr:MAG: hypothetical protein FD146_2607 [Anaerolineaceae bacterium]